jgi:O-acetyl-ADP-ribose deacetylase (regulator of RNase III)
MDAVVNAANAELKTGGGVAGAIHKAAGPGLEEECRSKAPIKPGEAVISGGHKLPNRYVIHCLGPVYGKGEPVDEKLADCYRNALALAEENGIRSIAFPAISTGAFGYPLEEATRVAVKKVLAKIELGTSLQHIRFVLHGEDDKSVYDQVVGDMVDGD